MEQGQSVRSGGRSALKFSRKWVQNGDAGTVSIRTAVDRYLAYKRGASKFARYIAATAVPVVHSSIPGRPNKDEHIKATTTE